MKKKTLALILCFCMLLFAVAGFTAGKYIASSLSTFDLTVNGTNVLNRIAVTTEPAKTTYNHGDDFNSSGMVVTAYYTDGTSTVINSYTITNGTSLYAGQATVTISYTENGVTRTATQAITVNKLNGSVILSATEGTLTYPTTGTFTVKTNVSGGKLSVTSSDESIAKASINGTTVTITSGTRAGTATITVTSAATDTYTAASATYKVTVENGTLSVIASGYTGSYDGSAHGITVASKTSGATIKYGTTSGSYTLASSPVYTNVGTYTVYYQVTLSGYTTVIGSAQVVITRASLTVPAQSGTLTYTSNAQSPSWDSNYNSSKMTLGGTTSGTNAGTYTATFTPGSNYQWEDGTTTAKSVNWSIAKASLTVPTQKNSLTYTGSPQSPTWNDYDSSKMTLGGTTSGTNAGTYTAPFTIKDTSNYQWSDGTTATKTVSWTIAKANSSVVLSASSGSAIWPTSNGIFTVNTNTSGGSLSVTTSNSSVASASISGTTVVIVPSATGTATITVNSAATANYNEASATYVVTVTADTSIITFNANGGSVSTTSKTVTYGSPYGDLPTPTKAGYQFIGWFLGTSTSSRDSSLLYKDRPMLYYADTYSDLYNAFAYNDTSLWSHYVSNGKNEGRRISQYISADIVKRTNDITLYAGWIRASASSIPIGSYVSYSANGYSSWRVLYNNSGQLDIVSTGSVGNYTLYGKDGYNNAVSYLNSYAANWATGTYATKARSIGCTSASTNSISGKSSMTGSPYTDDLYESDVNQLISLGMVQTDTEVWLASRRIEGFNDGLLDFGTRGQVRTLLTNGNRDYWTLAKYAYASAYDETNNITKGIRPVVSLQNGLFIVSGNGTASNPYVLSDSVR